ncbi:MAG TPA: TIGR02996 domain-containing protein [Gemmata sp.]
MNTGDALLRACLDNPDDDFPRLVYADWLQENDAPERAEFIRLQLVIARHWHTGDIPAGVEDREAELRSAHEEDWNPLPPALRDAGYFDRGFIDHVSVSTDEEAAAVALCPEVLCVSVGGENFTDVGLAHLATLPFLMELALHTAAVTGEGMRVLARHPRLRRIEINCTHAMSPWLYYLRDTPRLVRVRGYSTSRHEAAPEEWAAWEAARAERFRRLSSEDQQRAARAFLFDEIEYSGWKRDGCLRLIQCHITDADVELLGALPGVQNLNLYDTAITSRGLRFLSKHTGLHTLGLGHNAIDNLDDLARMTQLRELSLIGMGSYRNGQYEQTLADAGTAALSALTGLEALDLSFNPITDVTLARLAGLSNLRKLDLEETLITDAGLLHLRGLKNLEHLSLKYTQVTAAGARKLRTCLPKVKVKLKPRPQP